MSLGVRRAVSLSFCLVIAAVTPGPAATAFVGPELAASSAPASAPGGFLETASSMAIRPKVTPALPARGTFAFPAPYNTTGVRITNASDCGGADCINYVGYSYWRNMNNHVGSNTMYVFLTADRSRGGAGPTLFAYDKTTDQVTVVGPLFDPSNPLSWSSGEGWYFSATQPTKLYVTDVSTRLYRYDVISKQLTTVFDASTLGPGTYIWQVHSSNDDRVHSATLRSSATYEMLGCLIYREDTSQFSYFPRRGTFDECQIDKSGRWLLIKDDVDGLHGEDNVVVNVQTGAQTTFYDPAGAAGHSDNGFGSMVAADNYNNLPGAIRLWNFGQPFPTSQPGVAPQGQIVYHTTDWSADIGHVSHANAQPGVPLGQQYACGGGASRINRPRNNEIVCFPLDGSLRVLVVAPVMTDLNATGGGDDYGKMPKGNLDVTGQYFIWTSNVGGNRLDAFVVKVPAQLLTGSSDTSAPSVSMTAPVPGATVTGSTAVSAGAGDNVGVVGVQFKLDGQNLGVERTVTPYSIVWDTTTVANGQHALTAVARDPAGNSSTSAGVPVTVANGVIVGFADSFNRPDSATLGNGWVESSGDMKIQAGEMRNAAATGTHIALQPSIAGSSMTVSASFANVSSNGGPRFGLILRYQNPTNYYVLYRMTGGSSLLRISRVVNGVETVLGSATLTNPPVGSLFQLTAKAAGTKLTLELNGTTKLVSVSDSTFSSGSVGVMVKVTGGFSERIDEFHAALQ